MKLESLDLAIGMIVVFLLVSTLCSALREAIEALLKTRAAYLEKAIRQMLDDKDGDKLTKSLFEHPLLSGLMTESYLPKPAKKALWFLANGRGLPSYVPASSFAKALLDMAAHGDDGTQGSGGAMTVESLRARLNDPNCPMSPRVRRALLHALDTASGDLAQARKNVEDWFNDSMNRVSGWYKTLHAMDRVRHRRRGHADWQRGQHRHCQALLSRRSSAKRSGSERSDPRRQARRTNQGRSARSARGARAARWLERSERAAGRGVVQPRARMVADRVRGDSRRAVLVRRAEQGDGHSIDREAARKEPRRVLGRPTAAARARSQRASPHRGPGSVGCSA